MSRSENHPGPTPFEVYLTHLIRDGSFFIAGDVSYPAGYDNPYRRLYVGTQRDLNWVSEDLVAAGDRVAAMWEAVLIEVGPDHPCRQFQNDSFGRIHYRKGGFQRERKKFLMPKIEFYELKRGEIERQEIAVFPNTALARQAWLYCQDLPDWKRGPIKYEPVLKDLADGLQIGNRGVERLKAV